MTPTPKPARIAVVRSGDRPRLNSRLADLMKDVYPDHEIDDLDVFGMLRRRPVRSIANMAASAWEYRADLSHRRIRPKRAYVTSRSFARHVRSTVRAQVNGSSHRFTFQSQSLFDASVEEVPHFVFTDHTRLAGLNNATADPQGGTGGAFLDRETEIYQAATTVFVRSNHVGATLVDGYGIAADRVQVVGMGPNGDVPDVAHHGSTSGARVLFVGVDWERKGGPLLLDAIEILRDRHPELHLEIVGCEPDLSPSAHITIHGRVPLERVYALQQECDIFCLPTRFEPFGVAFIEAMHAGLPCIGPRLGAIPDMIESGATGLLHEPGDATSLIAALDALLTDRNLARSLGVAGRRAARATFSWDSVMGAIRNRVDAEIAS